MTSDEEAELLRLADDDDRREALAVELPSDGGAPCLVGRTATGTGYPTTATSYFLMNLVEVYGDEVEGQPGTLQAGAGTLLALNLGSAIPPVGTNVLCTFVRNRWVFRHD